MYISMLPETDQQQETILSPVALQSLKILQMSAEELLQHIEKELEENPFLEIQPENNPLNNTTFDPEYGNEEKPPTLNSIISKKTLKEHLYEQAGILKADSLIISTCNYIIENIDERGYLSCKAREIADELKLSEKTVNNALKIVQSFNPSGVAARNLKECLKIQLYQRCITDENVYKIIDNYLELIADNKLKEIAKCLNVDIYKAQEYLKIIRSLEPKPSRGFYTGNYDKYIIPEAYIKKSGTDLNIIANDRSLPQLILNNEYIQLIKQQGSDKSSDFLKKKYDRALFLVKGTEERYKTIYRIINRIIELQKEFFIYGESYLKPMSIGDIAEELQIHESTVSRAVRDKYISTPFKTIRIKDLFSSGIKSKSTDETISSTVIKNHIRNLIDKEDKASPLSDQSICEVLKKDNIEISRRTVAKYRDELNILSSGKRKEYSL